MNYPTEYHKAAAHLVAHGAHREGARGRKLCAQALQAMRAIGRDEARMARNHLGYISGCFPIKGGK